MTIKTIRILSEGDVKIVEFIGNDAEIVSVRLAPGAAPASDDKSVIKVAAAVMRRLGEAERDGQPATSEGVTGTPRESLRDEQRDQKNGDASADLDEALKDTFPASDPVAVVSTVVSIDHRQSQN